MDIKGINNNQVTHQFGVHNSTGKKEKDASSEMKIADKLQISEDAKKLMDDKQKGNKINTIKKRIEIGFYNSEAVISKVAERILNELG